jgi:hypothetical protein
MAIDKSAYQAPAGADPMEDDIQIEIPSEPIEGGTIDLEDGGAIIPFGNPMEEETALPEIDSLPPSANLVAYMDDDELDEIASDIISAQEEDDNAREEWKQIYMDGLDLLGMKIEDRTEPFDGASGVQHPLLAEAVVQFQAQAYKELLPAGGPVLTNVLGDVTNDRTEQATRVQEFMNYLITEVMTEYDPNMDQLLFYLPLGGSAFKKDYYDPIKERTCSQFITAEHITVPYSAASLEEATRIIHEFPMTGNDIMKYQATGFFSDEHLPDAGRPEISEIQEKVDELQGLTATSFEYDDEYTIFEAHVNLDYDLLASPEGIAQPYIVTLDKDSQTVLSIRKNYNPADPLRERLEHFVHYKFLPGLGFYGFGLIHMIGGLSKSATSILRQLIDAGTFANMQGGFKAKGLRVASDDEPIAPGEWRDVDAPGGVLRDALMPLPYKEPSQVLAGLLGNLVDSGQRFASIADMQVGDTAGQQQPVGTTVAMLERGTKVMSAIHKRLHYAQRKEFRILARLIKDSLPESEYPYEVVGAPKGIMKADFDDRIDILPVSDPNIFSMAQRVMLASQQLQMAQAAPNLHNEREAYYRMYKAMGISDIESVLKPEEKPEPITPLEEHRKVLQNKMLEAVPEMNHDVHIQMHLEFIKHPAIQQNIEFASNVAQDIMNHVKFKAAMIGQQTQQDPNMLEQQMMQEVMPQLIPQQPEDPVVAAQNRQMDIDEAYNQGRLDNEKRKQNMAFLSDREELQSEERIAQSRIFSNDNELGVKERLETLKAFLAAEDATAAQRQQYAELEGDILKHMETLKNYSSTWRH